MQFLSVFYFQFLMRECETNFESIVNSLGQLFIESQCSLTSRKSNDQSDFE